jgi:ubiquinone/menaquinone biosynthesis C-methylase UbiE
MANVLDWVFYVNFYNDIKAAGITSKDKAVEHYRIHGSTENRQTHLDVEKYLLKDDTLGQSLLSNVNNDSFGGISTFFLDYLINVCNLPNHWNVLELGCSIGCMSLPIIKHLKSGHYTGLDPNPICIEWANREIVQLFPISSSVPAQVVAPATAPPSSISPQPYAVASPTITSSLVVPPPSTVQSPVFSPPSFQNMTSDFVLPFADNQLDLVFSATTFTILPPKLMTKYLHEIHRVLKKGGQLIIGLYMCSCSRSPDKTHKIRSIKANNEQYITNNYSERATVHQGSSVYKSMESQHFEIKDTIFGRWSDTSNSKLYQDVIHAVKIK